MIAFENNKTVATSVLNRLGEWGSPKGLNIDPKLFTYWIDSNLAAVK